MTHRTTTFVLGLGLLLGGGTASDLAAQSVRAPRPFRGLFGGDQSTDPNRARQELMITVNLLGGYSDNISQELGGGEFDQSSLNESGSSGTFEGSMRYMYGKPSRSFTAIGTGYVTSYQLDGLSYSPGGSLQLEGVAGAGDNNTFRLTERVSFEPLFTLGSFAGLRERDAGADLPTDGPNLGLSERRLFGTDSAVLWDRDWSARNTTSLGYTLQTTSFADGAESHTHRVLVTYGRSFSRAGSFRASYNFSDGDFTDGVGPTRPLREHSIDAGPAFEKRLSRTRRLLFSFSAGGTKVESVTNVTGQPFEYWAPQGQGTGRVEFGRSWALGGSYRRSVVVLEGLSTESYLTNSTIVTTSGLVGSRLGLTLSGGFADGQAALESGSASEYRTTTFSAEAQFAITRILALTTEYVYYDYRFLATTLPAGFPPQFDRYSIRAGVTLRLPLYGRYVDQAGRRP